MYSDLNKNSNNQTYKDILNNNYKEDMLKLNKKLCIALKEMIEYENNKKLKLKINKLANN